MPESDLPSYAVVVEVLTVLAILGTAWIVVLTMGENSGNVISGGPPLLGALSCLSLVLLHYDVILDREVSFWAAACLGALGLWGAWVDYTHLTDRRKQLEKPRGLHK